MPAINGNLPFDAPENVSALMRRHSIFKAAIKEREAALDCFEALTSHD